MNFLHNRNYGKSFWAIGSLTAFSIASDFYIRYFYWGFPASERADFKPYMVRYDRISKPAACTCTRPDPSWKKHAIFAPRNGAVILARPVPDHPCWMQLPPGDYIESSTCSIALLEPIPEPLEKSLPRPFTGRWHVQYFTDVLREQQKLEQQKSDEELVAAASTLLVSKPASK